MVVIAAGCGTGEMEQPWPQPRALGNDIPSYRAGPEPAEKPARLPALKEPTGTLTMRQALALALARSPALAASSWEVRAAEARALQAALPPNPELRVRMDDFGGSGQFEGTSNSDQSIRLSQVLEPIWKISRRRQLAHLEARLAGWDYETVRLEVFARTARAFVEALAAQQRLALAREAHVLLQRVFQKVIDAASAGTITPREQMRARVRLANSKLAVQRAEADLAAAKEALAANWASTRPAFAQLAGQLEDVGEPPKLDALLAQLPHSPEVARWETEQQRRQTALELEKANALPDLRVLGGLRRVEDGGDYGFFLALEIDLPVFDRNQAGVREARFNRIKALHEQRAAEAAARAELRQAYQRLSAAHREIAALEKDVLPAAQKAFELARQAYKTGFLRYRDYLDAQRSLFRAKARHIDALAAYHAAVIDIERLTGQPLRAGKPQRPPTTPATHPRGRRPS